MPKKRRRTDSFVEWKKGIAYLEADGLKALRWRHLSGEKKTDGTTFREIRRYVAIVEERVRKRVKKEGAGGKREGMVRSLGDDEDAFLSV